MEANPEHLTREPVPRTIHLLGASFETDNLGVNALCSGAIAGIVCADPLARIVIGDYSRSETQRRVLLPGGERCEVSMLAFRFSWRLWLPNNIFRLLLVAGMLRVLPVARRDSWIRANRWLHELRSSQLVLAVNGGDSFSDIYGMRRLLYVLLPQFLALLLDRPVVQLPQTYGPFYGRLARCLARNILNRTSYIASRDHDGEKIVSTITRGKRRAEFTHDMAFLMPPTSPSATVVDRMEDIARTGDVIGLNISGLLWIGGYTRDNSLGVRGDYRELIRRIAAHLVGRYNVRILLVPHVYGTHGEGDVGAILQFLEQAQRNLRERLTFVDSRLDQNEIKWLIGKCDFFIGSRMHACIAALSQGVPAVGLAYSAKFAGVFNTIAVGDLALDLRSMDARAVVDAVDVAYRSRVDIRAKLMREVPRAQDSLKAFFTKVLK